MMATFREEGASMTEEEILNAIMDEMSDPPEAEQAKPKGQPPVQSETKDKVEEDQPTEDETEDGETEEGEPEEETEEGDEKPWVPSSLTELAEALGVDEDAVKAAIRLKTKVDGVESDVPLGEVLKNYQINKSLTERSEKLAHDRKAFEQHINEFVSARDQQIQQWQMWNQVLENRLKDQITAVDWQALRDDDPAEYAAKRQEYTERIAEVERLKAQVAQQAQAQAYQQAQAWQEQFNNVLQANIEALPNIVEEWKGNPERQKTEMFNLKSYLGNYYSPEEIGQVYDARHIAIARKAMLYDEMVKKGSVKLPTLKQKPKFVRPAARNSAAAVASKQSQKVIQRARESQSTDDWAKVLEDYM